ncbi:hypothetical protein [Taylorella equigenitalis]|uniref:hypothetical protein n=1 Tax=Taylorella equigenitalis TaxID=29575 RepID=UPI0030B87D81|nr:hypothetical protein KNO33_04950 [Taylorella equigenitalis]WDU48863.1 hypothetical protein KNO34_05005 [Taylorella equigenitalis]
MNFLFSILISIFTFSSNPNLSIDILFSSIHNLCTNSYWSGKYAECIYRNTNFINILSNRYIENLPNEQMHKNFLAYNNTINTLCRYHANSHAIFDYPSNDDAYAYCFINLYKGYLKTVVNIEQNSFYDKNCKTDKNKLALHKIRYLIKKAKILLFILNKDANEAVDLYDKQMYRTYDLSLEHLKNLEKQLDEFNNNGCFNSNISSILKILVDNFSEYSFLYIPSSFYKKFKLIAEQALLHCDSNCKRFDFNKWIKSSRTQVLSKGWFKYSEQFCSLLTSTLKEPDTVDYKKNCLYTKAYQLENLGILLSKFQIDNLDYYSIADLQTQINIDTNYLMKENRDWTKPLINAYKHFSNMYCHNKASVCKSFLEMIYLKDLIEIHAYQSKLIFKDLGIEPIESGLD